MSDKNFLFVFSEGGGDMPRVWRGTLREVLDWSAEARTLGTATDVLENRRIPVVEWLIAETLSRGIRLGGARP